MIFQRASQPQAVLYLAVLLLITACDESAPIITPPSIEEIIADSRLDLLIDEPYVFPVNSDYPTKPGFVALKKWDFVFTGPIPGHESNINNIIPGKYDHTLVYMGKDFLGNAYFVDLHPQSIEGLEGVRLISTGSDGGVTPHASGQALLTSESYGYRTAMRLDEASKALIDANEPALLRRITNDLKAKFPYQLEITTPKNPLLDRRIFLVDDGLAGGASCTDYWTALYEDYAGVCLPGARMPATELLEYYLSTPEGYSAYVPDEVNPFNFRVPIHQLMALDFKLIEDAPHVFRCDIPPESGLVMAETLMRSPSLIPLEPQADAPASTTLAITSRPPI